MAADDRNEQVDSLTVTTSFTDPGGTEHTGTISGGSGGLALENTDGTTLMSTSTLHANTGVAFTDDGDGTATLDVDEAWSPTWTSSHTWSSGLDLTFEYDDGASEAAEFWFEDTSGTRDRIGWSRWGPNSFNVANDTTVEALLQVKDWGEVRVPVGDITDGAGNIVYHQGNAHVPVERVEAQPAGKINASTSQSIPSGSWTQVTFDTTVFDTGSHTDTANNRVAVPSGGVYTVTARVQFGNSIADGTRCIIQSGLNGSRNGETGQDLHTGTSDYITLNANDQVRYAAGDTVELFAYQDSGSAVDLAGGNVYLAVTKVS